MEVIIPSRNTDFDFNSPISSPQVSTPTAFGGYYISAPTSPSHLSRLYHHFDDFSNDAAASSVAFGWEEKPGTPKSPPPEKINDAGDDFAFDVSGEWETASLSAEDLFDAGVIKPLKPPPRMQVPAAATSPTKKPASISRKIIHGAFSPRHRNRNGSDPFVVAAENAAKATAPPQRGRERGTSVAKSSSRRAARSLSPLRDTQYRWEEEQQQNTKASSSSSDVYSALSTSVKDQKKWRLRDFFLFRSASEGRAADKDPLKKYTAAVMQTSFRSNERSGSGSGSRRNGRVSAHELHYTANRAVSEDLKKKTFLPYKQGILGRLAFNPTVHALANGFGFSRN